MFMVEVGTHVRMGFTRVHEVAERKKQNILEILEIGHSGDLQFVGWQFVDCQSWRAEWLHVTTLLLYVVCCLEGRITSRNNAFAVFCLLKWTFEHFGHWPFWRFAIFDYVKKDHLLHILGLDLCIHKLKVQSK